MSVVAIAPRRWKKPPLIKRAWLRWTIGLGAAVYLALALGTTEVNWVRVWEGLPRGARFFAAFFPPDADPIHLGRAQRQRQVDGGELGPRLGGPAARRKVLRRRG